MLGVIVPDACSDLEKCEYRPVMVSTYNDKRLYNIMIFKLNNFAL